MLSALALVLAGLAIVVSTPAVCEAVPATAKLNAARSEASAARKKIDDLSTKLELATEDYEEAAARVKDTESDIFDANVKLKKAQAQLDAAQEQLNERAASIYRQDSISIIDVVLGADNFSDLVTRLDLMQRLSQQDSDLLVSVRSAKAAIETAKSQLETKRNEQAAAQREAGKKKAEAEALYAEQQSYLQSLNGKIKKLIAQERDQIEAQQKAAAEAAAKAQSQNSPSSGSASSGPVSGAREFDPSALGAPHPGVIAIAKKYVGKTPYVWGGTSPSGFDCSGLTQYCYAKIGVSIPRTSRVQYRVGAYIPPNRTDLLEPGDLLFFGYGRSASRIHHVALYAGGGRMIHAPQTGMKVSVTYLSSRSDFVGAVRP